jgi:phosphopantothenoylcysteine decarboxylase/phosphopantothenate--cysteine ligase
MFDKATEIFETSDIAVMSAAVADYTPANMETEKIKKNGENLTVTLVKTKDILKTLGERKKQGQILVGFALETQNERQYALQKLSSKNADLIVLNSLNDTGAGFGVDTNKITIFEKDGAELQYEQKPKQQVAKDIVDRIVNKI